MRPLACRRHFGLRHFAAVCSLLDLAEVKPPHGIPAPGSLIPWRGGRTIVIVFLLISGLGEIPTESSSKRNISVCLSPLLNKGRCAFRGPECRRALHIRVGTKGPGSASCVQAGCGKTRSFKQCVQPSAQCTAALIVHRFTPGRGSPGREQAVVFNSWSKWSKWYGSSTMRSTPTRPWEFRGPFSSLALVKGY